MALDGTLAGLTETLTGYLNRKDLGARIPDFISLCEAKLNREPVMEPLQEVDAPITTAVGVRMVAAPGGLTEAITLWIEWDWGRQEVQPIVAANLATAPVLGRPWFWAVDGANIAFDRPADQAYRLTLRCVTRFSLATGSPAALKLLGDHPDLYLYGALMEAAPYMRDDERLATWGALFKQTRDEVLTKANRLHSQARLRTDAGLRRRRRFNVFSGD